MIWTVMIFYLLGTIITATISPFSCDISSPSSSDSTSIYADTSFTTITATTSLYSYDTPITSNSSSDSVSICSGISCNNIPITTPSSSRDTFTRIVSDSVSTFITSTSSLPVVSTLILDVIYITHGEVDVNCVVTSGKSGETCSSITTKTTSITTVTS
jgi:hypothetical protein